MTIVYFDFLNLRKNIIEKNNLNTKIKRNGKILIGAVILLSFIFGWTFAHLDIQAASCTSNNISNKTSKSANVDFGNFWNVWDKIVTTYDGKIDYQKMIDGAINGMVASVGDPYTLYMTPEQTKSFDQELEGSINGIGAEVGIKDNKVIVISPISGSPAERAGIMANDIILTIDGTDTTGMDLGTAVSKIRGEVGTKVKLKIERAGKQLDFEVTRAKVDTKSVIWSIKDNNIGYIEITRFDSNTTTLVKQAASEFKEKDVKGIIIDLRNNPGGYLDSAVEVSSEFIKSGLVVSEKSVERDNIQQKYYASGKGTLLDTSIPVVVITNGGSASASEIVAGAIQDNKRGILLGEKTFGKGSVQTVQSLADGSSIRITIAHWFTPNGKNISKEGIKPDVEIKMTEDDIANQKDPQLDKSIEYIKNKIK